MPTIYTYAESNIRKTWILLTGFLVFIIGLGWVFSYVFQNSSILIFAVVFSLLMNVLSFWYSDKIILAISHASPIKKSDSPELYRIVENLCISAGLPLPRIYIIPESQPNAFATGRDDKHAVVAVTRGLLEKLDRAEIEGVIAHELSHIKNYDIRVMTIVIICVGIITLMTDFFLRAHFFLGGKRNDHNAGQLGAVLMIVGLVLAILSPVFATLIQLAVSRKREYLADASGVLLTRYPDGLAQALEKINRYNQPMPRANHATAHLYIANPFNGLNKKISALLSTHPPIQDRIARLRQMA